MALVIGSGVSTTAAGADSFLTGQIVTTGAVHWVDSATGNDANAGTEHAPLATLGQAITNATANNGDIVVIKSGHTQTVSSAITVNKAGLKIFGIGNGSSAPKFTCAAAIDCITVTADNVEINNLYFPVGTTIANTARINVGAANCRIKGCTFLCGQYDPHAITIPAAGTYCEIVSCTFTVSADGPDDGVIVESASAVGLRIDTCTFNGGTYNWDDAAVYSAVAHLNYVYMVNTFTGDACIKHTSSSSKGVLSGTVQSEGSNVQV